MIRKYVWDGKAFVEKQRSVERHHYVMGDIAEYGGRAKFREHLKRTGTMEMGHSDLRAAQEKWNSRKADHQAKVKLAQKYNVKPTEMPQEPPRQESSMLAREMANRLHGRPEPDRKTLIKLTLETARMLRGR